MYCGISGVCVVYVDIGKEAVCLTFEFQPIQVGGTLFISEGVVNGTVFTCAHMTTGDHYHIPSWPQTAQI